MSHLLGTTHTIIFLLIINIGLQRISTSAVEERYSKTRVRQTSYHSDHPLPTYSLKRHLVVR